MPEADEMYRALLALRKECGDLSTELTSQQKNGTLTAEVVAASLVDAVSLQADLAARLAEILSPEEALDEEDDEDEDDEEEDVVGGLEPEEAELFRRLLGGYREALTMMRGQLPEGAEGDAARKAMDLDLSGIERALGIVNDLELAPEDEEAAAAEESN